MKIFKKMTMVLMFASLVGLGGCSFWSTMSLIGTVVGAVNAVHAVYVLFPPASSLATFNASDAAANLYFSNTSPAGSSGNLNITISDQSSGQLLGQHTFSYSINGSHQMHFSSPSAVTNWVRSFSSYSGLVKVTIAGNVSVNGPPDGQSGSVSSTGIYQGTPYTSSRITLSRQHPRCPPVSPPGTCHAQ